MSEHVHEIDDQSFGTHVVQSQKPVLVDFWAPWCGPCKALGPLVEALAAQYGEHMVFTKLNIDNNPKIQMEYGIKAIPTVIIFKDGKPIEKIIGLTDRSRLDKSIQNVLAGTPVAAPFLVE